MIDLKEGDLLDFPYNIQCIAHSCNCHNVMGAGIAHSIKEKYPEAYRADMDANINRTNQLGNFSYANVAKLPDRFVFNLYTQYNFGRTRRHVDYDAFYKAIEKFHITIQEWQEASSRKIIVGFPYKISCNNAGGSWRVINSMLIDIFEKSTVDAIIVSNERIPSIIK